jgi:hypothetical protein
MKRKHMIKLVVSLTVVIGIIYFMGVRFTPESALKAFDSECLVVVGTYHITNNDCFMIYKTNYEEYRMVRVGSFMGLDRVTVVSYGIVEENGLTHVAAWQGGYYCDYMIVENPQVQYIAIGDMEQVEPYDGNVMSIYDVRHRYRDEAVVKKVSTDTICFWGYVSADEKLSPGTISTFDLEGDLIDNTVLY